MSSTCWGKSVSMITMRLRGQLIRSGSNGLHGEAKRHSVKFHDFMWGKTQKGQTANLLDSYVLYSLFIMYTI